MSSNTPGPDRQDYSNKQDFLEYAKWECLPRWRRDEEGMAMTQKEWAENHGYATRTVQKWKNRPEWDEVVAEITDRWIDDAVPEVVETAREVATDPNPGGHKDRKLILQLAGMGGQKMTIRHEGEVEHTHSLEEVRTMDESRLQTAMRAELRKRPQFAEASDDELDQLIGAFVEANAQDGQPAQLPAGDEGAVKDVDYVIADAPDKYDDTD